MNKQELKHQEHIVCVPQSFVGKSVNGFVDYEINAHDLMVGQRAMLESNEDFRQLIPGVVFTHKGKLWAYERTAKSGEKDLHNRIALVVGGHFDLVDLSYDECGVIDLEHSLRNVLGRELREEVSISSNMESKNLMPLKLAANDEHVDRVHLGVITFIELDGTGIKSAEDKLKDVGFRTPEQLLSDGYELETWTRLILTYFMSRSVNK